MQPEQSVISAWSNSAPYWEKYRETIRQMFDPVTKALVEDSRMVARQTVLDIATGPGEPALSIAAVVGADGKVCGIDPAPEMVAAARRATDRQGVTNTQFEVAFADGLPFPDNTFDAVVSRFGAMFFPSPGAAVREILRVLKPGGRLALAVWGVAEANPFFYALSRVVDRFVEPAPPDPDALDAFRFAAPGKLLAVFAEAGVLSPSERLLHFAIEAPVPAEEFFTLRTEMSEKLRDKLASLSADQLVELKQQAIVSLSEYAAGGAMSFPSQVVIVSGAKPC